SLSPTYGPPDRLRSEAREDFRHLLRALERHVELLQAPVVPQQDDPLPEREVHWGVPLVLQVAVRVTDQRVDDDRRRVEERLPPPATCVSTFSSRSSWTSRWEASSIGKIECVAPVSTRQRIVGSWRVP